MKTKDLQLALFARPPAIVYYIIVIRVSEDRYFTPNMIQRLEVYHFVRLNKVITKLLPDRNKRNYSNTVAWSETDARALKKRDNVRNVLRVTVTWQKKFWGWLKSLPSFKLRLTNMQRGVRTNAKGTCQTRLGQFYGLEIKDNFICNCVLVLQNQTMYKHKSQWLGNHSPRAWPYSVLPAVLGPAL